MTGLDGFLGDAPLRRVQKLVQVARHDPGGIHCPCCGQLAKVYHRKINSTMARWLIELVRRFMQEPRWYSVREAWSLGINGGTGDVAKLAYWDMIQAKPKDEDDTTRRTSGFWRPTKRGVLFVRGELQVPATAMIYDSRFLGWKDEADLVSVHEVLGSRFDYSELMSNEA